MPKKLCKTDALRDDIFDLFYNLDGSTQTGHSTSRKTRFKKVLEKMGCFFLDM